MFFLQKTIAQSDSEKSNNGNDYKWSIGVDIMPLIVSSETDSRYFRAGLVYLLKQQNDLLPTAVIRYQLSERLRLRSSFQYFQKSVTIDDPDHPDLATFTPIDSLGTTNRYFSISLGGEYVYGSGRIRPFIGGEFIYNYQRNAEQYFAFTNKPEIGPHYELHEERRKLNTYGGNIILGFQGMLTKRFSLAMQSTIQFSKVNYVGLRDGVTSTERATLPIEQHFADPTYTYRSYNDIKVLTLPMVLIQFHF